MVVGQKERDRAKLWYKMNQNDASPSKYPPCYNCKDYTGEIKLMWAVCVFGKRYLDRCNKFCEWIRENKVKQWRKLWE